MKRTALVILGTLLLWAGPAYAQAPTLVQQSPTALNACTPINATAAVNTAATVTLTPPAGQYVYVCGIDVSASNDNTATANTNASFTSTNLGPSGNTWAWKYSFAATASLGISQAFYFAIPLKSTTPGTAVTVVGPAVAHTMDSINVYYYYAP